MIRPNNYLFKLASTERHSLVVLHPVQIFLLNLRRFKLHLKYHNFRPVLRLLAILIYIHMSIQYVPVNQK